MTNQVNNPYLPQEAIILERLQETDTLFTLRLKFTDQKIQDAYELEEIIQRDLSAWKRSPVRLPAQGSER